MPRTRHAAYAKAGVVLGPLRPFKWLALEVLRDKLNLHALGGLGAGSDLIKKGFTRVNVVHGLAAQEPTSIGILAARTEMKFASASEAVMVMAGSGSH